MVDVPVLVVNAQYDIARDDVREPFVKELPAAKWLKFEASSHKPFWEEREKYMQAVGEFFKYGKADTSTRSPVITYGRASWATL